MEREVVFTGIGGQGIQLVAKVLAQAAAVEGKHAMLFGIYGGAMRGSPSESTLVIGDEEIQAFVIPAGDAELEPLDIIKHCEGKIAFFKVPRFVRFVDALPVSAAKNEVERHKLKEIGTEGSFDRVAVGYKVRRNVSSPSVS